MIHDKVQTRYFLEWRENSCRGFVLTKNMAFGTFWLWDQVQVSPWVVSVLGDRPLSQAQGGLSTSASRQLCKQFIPFRNSDVIFEFNVHRILGTAAIPILNWPSKEVGVGECHL